MIGMLKGFALTFGYLFKPGINQQYPLLPAPVPERSRGSVALMFGENGEMLCKACQLCSRNCPDDALVVDVEKPAEGTGRVLTAFKLDLARCMMCGLCVESCPANSLEMTTEFEHATADPAQMLRVLYERDRPDPAQAP